MTSEETRTVHPAPLAPTGAVSQRSLHLFTHVRRVGQLFRPQHTPCHLFAPAHTRPVPSATPPSVPLCGVPLPCPVVRPLGSPRGCWAQDCPLGGRVSPNPLQLERANGHVTALSWGMVAGGPSPCFLSPVSWELGPTGSAWGQTAQRRDPVCCCVSRGSRLSRVQCPVSVSCLRPRQVPPGSHGSCCLSPGPPEIALSTATHKAFPPQIRVCFSCYSMQRVFRSGESRKKRSESQKSCPPCLGTGPWEPRWFAPEHDLCGRPLPSWGPARSGLPKGPEGPETGELSKRARCLLFLTRETWHDTTARDVGFHGAGPQGRSFLPSHAGGHRAGAGLRWRDAWTHV